MKGFARKAVVCVVILSMFLSGCGTAMISLTEEEEAIVVAYATGAVAKRNRCLTQGLTYYRPEKEEEPQEEEQVQPEENENESETDTPEIPGEQGQPEQDEPIANVATLTEVLSMEGITAKYQGYQLKDSYVEGGYFAINAQEGNTYLIVNIGLTNTTQQPVQCNIYTKNMSCSLRINGTEKIQALTTIMLKDFLTYIDTIEPMAKDEVVVIFEVPQETVGSVQSLAMEIEMNEILYHIELE